jgi:hypothetical protein
MISKKRTTLILLWLLRTGVDNPCLGLRALFPLHLIFCHIWRLVWLYKLWAHGGYRQYDQWIVWIIAAAFGHLGSPWVKRKLYSHKFDSGML